MKLIDYINKICDNEKACDQLTEAYTGGTAREYLAGQGVELDEEELSSVAAGRDTKIVYGDGKLPHRPGMYKVPYVKYEWRGTDDNLKWRCPNCGRLVHPGSGWRYYCDPCNKSWFEEAYLEPNLDLGWNGWVAVELGMDFQPHA